MAAVNLVKKWAIDDSGQLLVIDAFLDADGFETTSIERAVTGVVFTREGAFSVDLKDGEGALSLP